MNVCFPIPFYRDCIDCPRPGWKWSILAAENLDQNTRLPECPLGDKWVMSSNIMTTIQTMGTIHNEYNECSIILFCPRLFWITANLINNMSDNCLEKGLTMNNQHVFPMRSGQHIANTPSYTDMCLDLLSRRNLIKGSRISFLPSL